MTTVTGLPPMVTALPGMPVDRAPTAAAVQARQAEAANGRTPGAGTEPLIANAVTGLAGSDRTGRLQDRRLPADVPPDPDELTGPPPTFETTPLEKLRYPPSPLEVLTRRVREMKTEGEDRALPDLLGDIDRADRIELPGAPETGAASERPAPRTGAGYGAETGAVDPGPSQGEPDNSGLNIRA